MTKNKTERMRQFFDEMRAMNEDEFAEFFDKVNDGKDVRTLDNGYVHIRYANDIDNVWDWKMVPEDKRFIGIAITECEHTPDKSEYNWFNIGK